MSLLSRIAAMFSGVDVRRGGQQKEFTALANFPTSQFIPVDRFVDYDSYLSAAERIGWVYIATAKVAEEVAMTKLFVLDEDNREVTIGDHVELLKKPNPFMTGVEFVESLMWPLQLVGNSYTLYEELDSEGRPHELWSLPAQHVKIIPDRRGFIGGFAFTPQGAKVPVPFPRDVVCHVKLPHPRDLWYGMGKIEAHRVLYNTAIAMDEFNWKWFENGATLGGVIESEGDISPEVRERMKADFEQRHKGWKQSHKIGILEGGAKFKETQLGQKDMEFVLATRLKREEVFGMFGLPPAMAGVLEYANYANMKEQKNVFLRETVRPYHVRLAAKLTKIVQLFEPNHRVEFDDVVKEDEDLKSQTAGRYFNLGALTPNEVRVDYLGLEPIDNPSMNLTYLPLGVLPTGDELPVGEEPAQVTEQLRSRVRMKQIESSRPMTLPEMKADGRRRILDSSLRIRRSVGLVIRRQMGVFFLDQERRFVKFLNEEFQRRSFNAKGLADFDWTGENSKVEDVMRPQIRRTMKLTIDVMNQLTGSKVKEDDTRLIPARARLLTKVKGINETTRREIDEQVKVGVDRGYSIDQIAQGVAEDKYPGVRGVFSKATKFRAETIARTETSAAFDQAAVVNYSEVGVDTLDVIGCEDGPEGHTMPGEKYGCLSQGIPIREAPYIKFHPNHVGVLVPSRRRD